MSLLHSVHEMMEAFLEKERAALDSQGETHAPTIGAMYEGLTRTALDRAIPEKANLRVVSGFARGSTGQLSNQLDCMLVTGEGNHIPHTSSWIYDLPNVIAVVEVKKTLYGSEVTDGYDNLASVMHRGVSGPLPLPRLARAAFQAITRYAAPSSPSDLDVLDPRLAMHWHLAQIESSTPVRILLGYHGYKSVAALGAGVVDHLTKRIGIHGNGPLSWPNMVANAHGAVVKANGMPWALPLVDGWWNVMVRLDGSPSAPLLELIWSRLNYMGLLDAVAFGDDREQEQVRPLIKARLADSSIRGWELDVVRPGRSRTSVATPRPLTRPWQPVEISLDEHTLLALLCEREEIDVANLPNGWPAMREIQSALERLQGQGLVGPDPTNPNKWRLLTVELGLVFLPDGRAVAGENNTGRLSRWVLEQAGPGSSDSRDR